MAPILLNQQIITTTTTTTNSTANTNNNNNNKEDKLIPTVDITLIEQQKENITPLASGRSATHLNSLSLTNRSTLETKLSNEHLKFQSQINAISVYESTGHWEEGKDGFTTIQIATLADDPLEVHHLYVRFVLEFYPAGASATSRLVPLLEESTRKFINYDLYKNDPRYLRLWTTYAGRMNNQEDVFRFLFAKGVGERLASLYEEYARVLEVVGKRQQADQVYSLGIDRLAQPLARLKKSYLDFQARMLLAPPITSPLPSTTSSPFTLTTTASSLSSSTSRSLNGSSAPILGISTSSTTPARENNKKDFSIFQDDDDDEGGGVNQPGEGKWEDLGTMKSRRRENDLEATEWKGETMVMGGRAILPTTVTRIEVFRDDDVPPPPPTPSSSASSSGGDHTDTLSKSIRGPSEADLLKQNPFKNYSAADLSLTSIDPILEVTPKPSTSSRNSGSGTGSKSRSSSSTSKSGTSKSKSSSSKSKSSSSSTSTSTSTSTSNSTVASGMTEGGEIIKPKERTACDLKAVYPESGVEFSFEELKLRKNRNKYEVDSWSEWEWFGAWKEEVSRTGVDSYVIDPETSFPILYDAVGAPLWEFLPRPVTLASPIRPPIQQLAASPSPLPRLSLSSRQAPPLNLLDLTPVSSAQRPSNSLAFSPLTANNHNNDNRLINIESPQLPPALQYQPSTSEAEDSPVKFFIDPLRPPSPTMNTRAAEAMVNDLFAHTLRFGGDNFNNHNEEDEEEEEEEEVSTADESEDDEDQVGGSNPFFIPTSQASQYSQFEDGSQMENQPFVPFSQTASQLENLGAGDSFRMGSQAVLEDLSEEDEEDDDDFEDENGYRNNNRVIPQPMTLFRDPVVTALPIGGINNPVRSGFRPMTKPSVGGRTFGTPMASQRAFMVMQDEPDEEEEENRVLEEEDEEEEEEQQYEEDEYRTGELGDGFNYGRRPQGANRFAPMIDNMTPIVERTEHMFGSVTRTSYSTSTLSNSQRSRRDSAYPITGPVMEEEEEEDDEEEDDVQSSDEEASDGEFGDRAFNGFPEATGSQSDSSSQGSSSDDEGEDLGPLPQPSLLVDYAPSPSNDSIPEWRDSTRKDAQFDEVSGERSYDASLNGSLPEGFTINGNQSGMTTGLVLTDTSTNFGASHRESSSAGLSSNPCNPYTTKTIDTVLSLASPPVLDHPLVRNFSNTIANKLADLQKTAKKREAKKAKDGKGKDRTGVFDEAWELELEDEVYSVREKLGEGAFGAVFRIATQEGDPDDYDDEEEISVAVKVEQPTNLWEFHILQQLHSRLSPRIRTSVVSASKLYAFKDESYLFLDFSDQGTLLDTVNKAVESGISPPTGSISLGLEEVVAMFFTIELLRVLEGFHNAGFVHGDLKIDNCLLRLEEPVGGSKAWSSTYDPTGGNGWSSKGLKIIDFGRSIDRSVYPVDQTFLSTLPTDEFDCIEMRESKSWTFEPDYFGAASIAFNLLFGKYIETKEVVGEGGERKFVIAQSFKRYHQEELWTSLFDALLNPKNVREDGQLPITSELTVIRVQMECWLEKNSDKNGKNLRSLIRKMETYWLARQ